MQLAQEIADLTGAIAEIDAAVAKATKEREAEKASKATALVQGKGKQPEVDAPPTFDAPYQGMGDNAGGVVGMLEVIASDFARLEAETSSSEEESQKEFERFSAESSKDKAVKTADM